MLRRNPRTRLKQDFDVTARLSECPQFFKSLCNVYRIEMRSPAVKNKKCLRRIIFRPPGKLSFPPAVSQRRLPVVRKTSADLLERKIGGRTENHKQSLVFSPDPLWQRLVTMHT